MKNSFPSKQSTYPSVPSFNVRSPSKTVTNNSGLNLNPSLLNGDSFTKVTNSDLGMQEEKSPKDSPSTKVFQCLPQQVNSSDQRGLWANTNNKDNVQMEKKNNKSISQALNSSDSLVSVLDPLVTKDRPEEECTNQILREKKVQKISRQGNRTSKKNSKDSAKNAKMPSSVESADRMDRGYSNSNSNSLLIKGHELQMYARQEGDNFLYEASEPKKLFKNDTLILSKDKSNQESKNTEQQPIAQLSSIYVASANSQESKNISSQSGWSLLGRDFIKISLNSGNRDLSKDSLFYDLNKPQSFQNWMSQQQEDKPSQENKVEEMLNKEKIIEEEKEQLSEVFDQTQRSSLEGHSIIETIGKGAHGTVLKVVNEKNEIRAAKEYPKDQKKAFMNEVHLLKQIYGEIWHEDMFLEMETERSYFMILKAGIGTLSDLKRFLKEEIKELTESDLLTIFLILYSQYQKLLKVNFCHRDIKPDNIILDSENLTPYLIDYSLAVPLDPKTTISGWAGTSGYIAPHIRHSKQPYGKEELVSGDLFSLGITLLEIAVPTYCPIQNDIQGIKIALSKLKANKNEIYNLLKVLLFYQHNFKITDAQEYAVKCHSKDSEGLRRYYRDFSDYLSRLQNGNAKSELVTKENILFAEEFESNEQFTNENPKSGGDSYFQIALKKPFSIDQALTNLKFAARYYQIADDKGSVIQCYENIAKCYYRNSSQDKFLEICSKIYQISQDDPIIFDPLTYSTLGINFYLQKDILRAKTMFLKGLRKSQKDTERLILLNNYLCTLFTQDENEQSYVEECQKILASNMFDTIDTTFSAFLVASFQKKEDFVCLTLEENRIFEIIVSMNKELRFRNYPKTPYKAINWIVFRNFCAYKAVSLMGLLESHKNPFLRAEIHNLTLTIKHSLQNPSLKLNKIYYIPLLCCSKLKDLFSEEHRLASDRFDFVKLRQEAETLFNARKHICKQFQENKAKVPYKDLLKLDLFYILVGLFLLSDEKEANSDLSSSLCEQISVISEFTNIIYLSHKHGYFEGYFERGLDQKIESFVKSIKGTSNLHSNLNAQQLMISNKFNNLLVKCELKVFQEADKIDCTISTLGLKVNRKEISKLKQTLDSLSEMKSLERLSIRFNSVPGTTNKIYQEVNECLKSLRLSQLKLCFDTYFSPFGDNLMRNLQKVTVLVSSLNMLETLKIHFTGFLITSEWIYCWKEAIKQLNNLTRLKLFFYNTEITDDNIILLGETISKLPLVHLTFEMRQNTNITSSGVHRVESLLKNSFSTSGKQLYFANDDYSYYWE